LPSVPAKELRMDLMDRSGLFKPGQIDFGSSAFAAAGCHEEDIDLAGR